MNEDGVFVPNKFYLERKQKKEVQALTEVVTSVSGKKKAGLTYALDHIAASEGFAAALTARFGDKMAKGAGIKNKTLLAHAAMKWVFSFDEASTIVYGTRKAEHLNDSASILDDLKLSEEEFLQA
jgi:aryl-alcohol dehydrogenase-like predicted oxidoreductase